MKVFLLLTALILFQLSAMPFVDFGPNIRIDDDTLGWSQGDPSLGISTDGETLYCVFVDFRYGYHDFPGLTFTKSTDRGNTWTQNKMVYYGEWDAETSPRIVADSQGWLHIVFGILGYGGIMYTRSTDGGETWTVPVRISDTITASAVTRGVELAIDRNDNLYAMWSCYYEEISNGYDVFFTKSTDYGNTWLHPNRIVNDTVSCENLYPSFCLGGPDTIYAVWEDDRLTNDWDIFFSFSTDGGITWLTSDIKVNPDTNYFNCSPRICIDTTRELCCVWIRGVGNEGYIDFSKSSDNGATWLFPVTISESLSQSLGLPSFDIDSSGNMYVVWHDCRLDSADIFFTFSTDCGNTWYSPNIRVNDDTTQRPQSSPDILVKGPDDIYVVWTDSREDTFHQGGFCGPDIYFARGSIIGAIDEKCFPKKLANTIELQIIPNPSSDKVSIVLRAEDKRLNALGTPPLASNIRIYDITGRMIKSFNLAFSIQNQVSSIVWDGKDNYGYELPAGIYFIILKSTSYCITQKVVLAR